MANLAKAIDAANVQLGLTQSVLKSICRSQPPPKSVHLSFTTTKVDEFVWGLTFANVQIDDTTLRRLVVMVNEAGGASAMACVSALCDAEQTRQRFLQVT